MTKEGDIKQVIISHPDFPDQIINCSNVEFDINPNPYPGLKITYQSLLGKKIVVDNWTGVNMAKRHLNQLPRKLKKKWKKFFNL